MKKYLLILIVIFSAVGTIAISGCGKEKVYTVTFDANGGNGMMKQQPFVKNVQQTLISNKFTRHNYLFSGWNTIPDGSGISYSDAQEIIVKDDITLYAQWKAITGNLNNHTYIDLGLPSGLLWATCNIGAEIPEAYGDYFAWGETAPKQNYTYDTYIYYDGNSLTKYTGSDNLTTLESTDDAATVNWGDGWRMPTYDEMCELRDNCVVVWTTQKGTKGRLFTGPNGNSIFFPASGYYFGSAREDLGVSCGYWASNLGSGNATYVWDLYFDSSMHSMYYSRRDYGRSIRAVCSQK